jgi:UDP-glucose 4-epimerase
MDRSPPFILVAGGAGYIGAHMVRHLQRVGYTPIVLDNLSTGHREAVGDAQFIFGDIADSQLLDDLFQRYPFLAVMHFASFIQVGESVHDPIKYYHNNAANTLCLLRAMLKSEVKNFIFSSSAAVYGEPRYMPIDEAHPIAPMSPYGHSKHMIEQVLSDMAKAYDFRFAALRYFNAAGADPEGDLSECHEPETHLIPLVLQTARGEREAITIFGEDYPTSDGTCVRDYIHVVDLCRAHQSALEALSQGRRQLICNLGTGKGYSVLDVIATAERVTQQKISIKKGARRAGDPAILVADPSYAIHELNWQPQYPDLEIIIQHAWHARAKIGVII